MIRSIKTKITTPRFEEKQAFYRRIFGMVVAEAWDDPDDTGVILALCEGDREAYLEIYHGPEEYDFSGLSLQFRVDDIRAFEGTLPPDMPRKGPAPRPWRATYLFITDPNGIRLNIFEGGL